MLTIGASYYHPEVLRKGKSIDAANRAAEAKAHKPAQPGRGGSTPASECSRSPMPSVHSASERILAARFGSETRDTTYQRTDNPLSPTARRILSARFDNPPSSAARRILAARFGSAEPKENGGGS